MSNSPGDPEMAGPRHRHVEMGVAAFLIVLGAVTVFGSLKVGIGWGAEGPQSGFFPFWVGLLIVLYVALKMMWDGGQDVMLHLPR